MRTFLISRFDNWISSMENGERAYVKNRIALNIKVSILMNGKLCFSSDFLKIKI